MQDNLHHREFVKVGIEQRFDDHVFSRDFSNHSTATTDLRVLPPPEHPL